MNSVAGALAGEKKYLKVVLAGNPNAGKTTLFNTLTKSSLRTGNFHGVTCSAASKTVGDITFTDVPGLYAFTPYSMEEVSAVEEIKSADLVINVIDALTLENSLNLTEKMIKDRVSVIVFITKLNSLKRRGGSLDFQKLSQKLGVPVLSSVKELKKALHSEKIFNTERQNIPLKSCYSAGNLKINSADKLFYNKYFALFFFVASITAMFFLAFHPSMPGAVLKNITEELICVKLSSLICVNLKNEAVISLVSDGILGGAGSVLSFIPQLTILYLVLTLLDESGITSALSFVTDGIFEKVHLSGRAAFSLVSGFGCTAAAILTTRGYTSKSAQKRTVAILPFIPCGAKLPVFLTFLSPLFKNPFPVITCFYFGGVAFSLLVSLIIKGGRENILSEVTPIVIPSFKAVIFKLFFYVKGFIIKVAGAVLLFCVLSWFLSSFSFRLEYVTAEESMLASISKIIAPVFYPMGITDWRLAYAALCGFAAKENVAATVAMLFPEGLLLPLSSSLAICTFILLCPACISAFTASCKEVGVKFTLKCVIVQLIIALLGAYTVNLLFCL